MTKNVPQITTENENVLITIPKEKISEFIGDVLKNKRQISKNFLVNFNLDKNHVENIVNVIQHRINEQNKSQIVDVSIDVFYDDGSSRTYNDVNSFMILDDNLSSISVAIFIRLSYLISFGNEPTPTKHEIIFSAKSNNMGSVWGDLKSNVEANLSISVRTNRFTWAEDVINHFSNFVKGEFDPIGKFPYYVKYIFFNGPFSQVPVIIIFLTIFIFTFFALRDVIDSVVSSRPDLINFVGGYTLNDANKKLDALLLFNDIGKNSEFPAPIITKYVVYFATFLMVFYIAPISYAYLKIKNYVSIGRISKNRNDKKLKRNYIISNTIVGGTIVSLLISIFSNFLWEIIREHVI